MVSTWLSHCTLEQRTLKVDLRSLAKLRKLEGKALWLLFMIPKSVRDLRLIQAMCL